LHSLQFLKLVLGEPSDSIYKLLHALSRDKQLYVRKIY
jgi:hypothetical protein